MPGKGELQNKQLQYRQEVIITIIQNLATIINNAIRYGTFLLIAYFLTNSWDSIFDSLAGRETDANILVEVLSNFTITHTLSLTVTFGAIFIAIRERSLRKKEIERLVELRSLYVKQFDSNRSSSGLTKRGETQPEDR